MVRIKKRYFALRLERREDVAKAAVARAKAPPLALSDAQLIKAIRELVGRLHGDHGRAVATSGLRLVYLNGATGVALVCCRHGPHRLLASALPFLSQVGQEDIIATLIYTGATVRNTYEV
jgi:ribonuclease P/MRP protein subunit POP5